MEKEQKGNAPAITYRAGGVKATVWKNEVKQDKKEMTFFTVVLVRSYKDKDDKWQETSSLRINDLPKARMVLAKAYEYLAMNSDD